MKKTPRSWRRGRMGSRSRKRWARVLALTLVFALAAPLGGWVTASGEAPTGGICIHHPEHDEACGYAAASEGAPCTHVHDGSCGYIAPEDSAGGPEETDGAAKPEATGEPEDAGLDTGSTQTPAQTPGTCNHEHDDACGYAEATQGYPCNFVCPWCVTGWEWDDEAGVLVWNGDVNLWGLGVPGTDAANPLTREALEELLPQSVTAQTAEGEKTVSLVWNFGALPEEGAYQGTYTLTASLEGEYVLTGEAPALSVLLELGGGEPMALEANPKFLNDWAFVSVNGANLPQEKIPEITVVIPDLAQKAPNKVQDILTGSFLPRLLSGWVPTDSVGRLNTMVSKGMFITDTERDDSFYEMTADGEKLFSGAAVWGYVTIDDWSGFPSTFEAGKSYTLTAVLNSHDGYKFYVNSNNATDHKDPSKKNTSVNPDILQLTVTIQNEATDKHTVPAAAPENVTVNLFDYWVDTDGANGNDLLPKNGFHVESETSGKLVQRTSPTDWKKGINQGRLLLFGDGNIHAGFWNKGAGAGCNYGKNHAGMMGIVENTLVDGYPVINVENMYNSVDEYTGISDWALCGDHDGSKDPNAYTSINPKNISNTVIDAWKASGNSASLDYLFNTNTTAGGNKRVYEDVQGLFRLDAEGYYSYDMRQNFAELRTENGEHRFILYDAPAVERTDASYDNGTGQFKGERSVGNFLPFNTASQVFDGLQNGKLYSSENIKTHNEKTRGALLNHHLGMTVEIPFRQPENGKINMGTAGDKPMSFQFSGDDDVWVFIDDVLVLDLGGIHSEIYGTIDFQTGNVYIGQSWKTNGFPRNGNGTVDVDQLTKDYIVKTTLYKLFEAARKTNSVDWNEEKTTFANNTDHVLKMFFLERGNYDSSLAVRFNLQPVLYQEIKKVDQDGNAVPDITFELYPAVEANEGDEGAIQCLYTDDTVQTGKTFYVKQAGNSPLTTLTTDEEGVAQFKNESGLPYDFAGSSGGYYILKEKDAPEGYRALPTDIVLHYNSETSMLSVANRWTTGAYACSTSNVMGAGTLTYGSFETAAGDIKPSENQVSPTKQSKGLIVAVPMLWQKSRDKWVALYGSNLGGFGAVEPGARTAEEWRKAVLTAALYQLRGSESPLAWSDWRLSWDGANQRLVGTLHDLPGLASQYRLNNANGNMRMVYGIIEPDALVKLLNIKTEVMTSQEIYNAFVAYLADKGDKTSINNVVEDIMKVQVSGTGSGAGFSFLNVDQFNRDFRAMIYIPNDQRELRVWKVDQDGRGVNEVEFGLYRDKDCTDLAVTGKTANVDGRDGVLLFAPYAPEDRDGYAKATWAKATAGATYYLKELSAPSGYTKNDTVIPIVVGTYAIYADAGKEGDGVKVMAGVGRLTQTMRQYAMDDGVDITLRDITAYGQSQPSTNTNVPPEKWGNMELETTLEGNPVLRSMNLHFGLNEVVDYGLHNVDGGKNYMPFFVTDTGFIRTSIRQNYPALLPNGPYQDQGSTTDTNKDNLGDADITSLFALLNVVVVTDKTTTDTGTGQLTISKKVSGDDLAKEDFLTLFAFKIELIGKDEKPLADQKFYFYGTDKAGYVASGDTLMLHHDESITILGLPEGTQYTVTEETKTGWYVVSKGGEKCTGTIEKDKTAEALFENSRTPTPSPDSSMPVVPPSTPPDPKPSTPVVPPSTPPDPKPSTPVVPSAPPSAPPSPSPSVSPSQSPDPSPSPNPSPAPSPDPSASPTPPEDPENPPEDPENPPEDPENPPEDPETPPEEPETPPYPTELPDPNDPDAPDTITIWEDGVPKTYIRVWNEETEEFEYILEEDLPLANRDPEPEMEIPATGDERKTGLWLLVNVLSLTGLAAVCFIRLRKKKRG